MFMNSSEQCDITNLSRKGVNVESAVGKPHLTSLPLENVYLPFLLSGFDRATLQETAFAIIRPQDPIPNKRALGFEAGQIQPEHFPPVKCLANSFCASVFSSAKRAPTTGLLV